MARLQPRSTPPDSGPGILTPDEARQVYASIPSYPFDIAKAKGRWRNPAHPDGFEISVPARPPIRT